CGGRRPCRPRFELRASVSAHQTAQGRRLGLGGNLELRREGDSYGRMPAFLLALGLPTLGLAFAISALTTYGPEVLIHRTGLTWQIGALIGAEGLFALTIRLSRASCPIDCRVLGLCGAYRSCLPARRLWSRASCCSRSATGTRSRSARCWSSS